MQNGQDIGLNAVVRFLLELIGIAAAAYWGFNASGETWLRVALAIAAPLLLIALWWRLAARWARNGLSDTARYLIGSVLLLITAFGLAISDQVGWAIVFAALILGNTAIFLIQRPSARRSNAD